MKFDKKQLKNKYIALALIFICCLSFFTACGKHTVKAEYEIEISGTVEESGIIDYAGLAMNVYKDLASNPCGTCPNQPVSVYVGASAEEIVKAMSQAVTKADDIWIVKECNGNILLLQEKEIDTAEEPEILEGPNGITLKGAFTPAH